MPIVRKNRLGARAELRFVEAASLQRLARHSRVLLLQGPNGPFFSRLRDKLEASGSVVWKVNFNGGDDLFYRGAQIIRFSGPMPRWQHFLRELLVRLQIDAIAVFGSNRRQHRIAARVANELGIAFWVFEEGYIRPDYITLELGGVNADSPMESLTVDEIPALPVQTKSRKFNCAFAKMAWWSFWYFASGMALGWRYPDYHHHKPFRVNEIVLWLRAAYRKQYYRSVENPIVRRLLSDGHPPFFLVALQVYNDSQIRIHSPWRRIEDFIEWTIYSFAHHAPSESILVIKHHPMDRGHKDYTKIIEQSATRFGATSRVMYIHDVHLPSLLHRCEGVVTINSTTGLQAMYHRVPVIALGRCFYAKAGLTYQGSLDDFWKDPGAVDAAAYRRFRNYIIHSSQINSSFYADATLSEDFQTEAWHKRWPARLACVIGLIAGDSLSGRLIDLSALLSMMHRASAWLVG
nr:capsular biosynthesis protein [Cupriavidus gilardii]